jgi:hypothetical protein
VLLTQPRVLDLSGVGARDRTPLQQIGSRRPNSEVLMGGCDRSDREFVQRVGLVAAWNGLQARLTDAAVEMDAAESRA